MYAIRSYYDLVNEAALHAAKLNKNEVDMGDFEEAKDKVLMRNNFV